MNEDIKEIENGLAKMTGEKLKREIHKEYISKDKIREKLEQFRAIKKIISEIENELGIPSITYDIVRNDYCERLLEDLLEEENENSIK